MLKISVIVPVYNSEKTLCRCVDSVLRQTYQNFELLIINDGSLDHSGEICDEYAQKDSRVRVIHKTNGGVSSARNVGLDNARGEWVTFVDSDDYLQEEYLNSFPIACNADVIIGSFIAINEMGSQVIISSNVPPGVYFHSSSFTQEYITNTKLKVPWCKFYRKSLLSDIRFNEKMVVGEDWHFNMTFFALANELLVLSKQSDDLVNYVYAIPSISFHIKYQLSVS